ncbi:FkbM family methyltransferase [Zavarzinia compransoris]|uniref:FkbM family methyltransferase n=1 Tax=Zavarzinia marina TaxID=2911065 RepID=UPI001EEDEE8E|nr:FkbM family methyltransferase [Zavarzinia marina]MCF4165092.1 FkbM family methyltransferase [Zavarzinia marina]
MLRRIRKLLTHPGFRADPLGTLFRAGVWFFCVLFRKSPVFRIAPGGGRLRVPPDLRYTSVSAFLMRDWTEPELHFLDRLLGPGDTFVDAGANIGIYTLRGAPLVGQQGIVVAVEPGAVAFAALTANLALNPEFTQVRPLKKALSDSEGEAVLHHIEIGNDPQAFSLLTDGSDTESEKVALTTLDAVAAEFGFQSLACVKMDVEGAEPMLIAGGRQTIERFKPIVLFEINTSLLERKGDATDDAFGALVALGYEIFRWTMDGRLDKVDSLPDAWGNLVAVHPQGQLPRRP